MRRFGMSAMSLGLAVALVGLMVVVPAPAADGLGAVASRAAASDAEVFAVAVPFEVSEDEPEDGAGRWDSAEAVHRYEFTLAGGGPVFLDHQACPERWRWALVADGSGDEVASGSGQCESRVVEEVPAGDYALEMRPWDGDHLGVYGFGVFVAPQAEEFEVSLPLAVSRDAPEHGAGFLGVAGAGERYGFSVDATATLELEAVEPGGLAAVGPGR